MKERKQIEPSERGDGFWVWGIGQYSRGSVLAGRTKRRRIRHFDTLAKAQAAHPDAETMEGCSSSSANWEDTVRLMREPPPADFDPADAGETW